MLLFLCQVQKGEPYTHLINVYGTYLAGNDALVCHFVNNIHPGSVCHHYSCMCTMWILMLCNNEACVDKSRKSLMKLIFRLTSLRDGDVTDDILSLAGSESVSSVGASYEQFQL